ncbi:MAG: 1,4-dihydroxy-6-naphthoate synthase [Methanosarcinales archaeon]|nr:MAG: 1,4-dihydroxy-6-naphthoate synthase [Methanosarcinales archaeon]
MAKKYYSLGYSTCPNDTFIFHALAHDLVDTCNVRFNQHPHTPYVETNLPVDTCNVRFNQHPHTPYVETNLPVDTCNVRFNPHLHDIETLNQQAFSGCYDVSKLSYHALGFLLDEYSLLRSGSALGRGCGPIIVAQESFKQVELTGKTIAVPGKFTTAYLLLQLFEPKIKNIVAMPFDKIMPAVAQGIVDAGAIIHESRFTYPLCGLRKVVDLGEWWEDETGKLIPLGCVAAKRSIGKKAIDTIDTALCESIKYANKNPGAAMQYVKQYAQEMADDVIQAHIGMYVNDYTIDIGIDGTAAVETLFQLAREQQILPQTDKPLF